MLTSLTLITIFANINAQNQLNWIGISKNQNSTQVVFDFAQKITFRSKYSPLKNAFKLSFLNDSAQKTNDQIIDQINKLKLVQLFDNIEITNKNNPQPKQTFKFFSTKQPLVIQVKKLDEGNAHRIALNIFSSNSISQKLNLNQTKNICIVLDPGHGGNAQGAAFFGQQEKNINLQLSHQIAQLLAKDGFNVQETRTQDIDLSLPSRIECACNNNANLFVSLHVNSAPSPTATGIETYFHTSKTKPTDEFYFINTPTNNQIKNLIETYQKKLTKYSQSLAQSVQSSLVKTLQPIYPEIRNRGVKSANFYVLSQNLAPAILIEVGFLSNSSEAQKLTDPKYRQLLAQGICKGIKQFAETLRN
jgi:N-acetylmuramoyl-L-alanine amidase